MKTDTKTNSLSVMARERLANLTDGASIRKDFLLRELPPEWNSRALTRRDFRRYCDEAGIITHEAPFDDLPGCYLPRMAGVIDHPHIFLDDKLRGGERLFVAFHELGHHWLHSTDTRKFQGPGSLGEIEADTVAVCALIPKNAIASTCYPPELVRLRREVFNRWRI